MVGHAEMKALAGWCAENGVRLISDEIYHGIVYEGDTASAVEVSDQAIVVNSFSKYFSMTGWRVGWLVVPQELVRPIERLAQNFFISVPTLASIAALAAFECRDELDGHVRRYRRNRDLLLAGLPEAGLRPLRAGRGRVLSLLRRRAISPTTAAISASRMLAETGVATTPGVDFDRARGAGTLRISFAGSTAEMEEAVRRLKAWRRT